MKNLIVIDDFYRNPQAVRDYALNKVDYFGRDDLANEFAGTESKQSFYTADVVAKIERAVGQTIKVEPEKYSFAVFWKTFASDARNLVVHVDQSDWTGLVYLSRPQDCQGGTSFYQHKESGLDTIPDEEQLQALGYESKKDFVQRFVTPQGKSPDHWRQLARVGMKFNRMILFRAGDMFHGADGYFGDNDENCRLLQLFFFKTEAGK